MTTDDHVSASQPRSTSLEVVVIGAGLSGLSCARTLDDHGHRVRVLEKSRGPGGRTATRREGEWRFDHGAQYFTVRDPRFRRCVESWREDGFVARWTGRIAVLGARGVEPKDGDTDRFVGVPGMNAVCRHLAEDLDVRWRTRVARIEHDGDRWRLTADDGADLGAADAVVVSAPPAQTAELLAKAAPALADRARAVDMAPCWAAMVVFDRPLEVPFDGAFVHGSPLSWVAREASKPGRPAAEAWVLHTGPDWSEDHLEIERQDAAARLLDAFREAIGGIDADVVHLDAHRWRFALPREPLTDPCLFDRTLQIAACGDWCGGPRVEGACLSGLAVAEAVAAGSC
jgi:predicted NAD/FAD-dependent oxidoreductase